MKRKAPDPPTGPDPGTGGGPTLVQATVFTLTFLLFFLIVGSLLIFYCSPQ